MIKRIEIWHSGFIFWFLLLVFRNELLFNISVKLISEATYLPVKAELISEFLVFLVLPVIILVCRKKLSFLRTSIRFYNLTGVLLLFMFLFPGIIAGKDPDFRKDLSVTKLLPPFSSVNVLHIISPDKNIIYVDSIRFEQSWIYFQKQRSFGIQSGKFRFEGDEPLLTTKTFILGTDILGRDVFARVIFGVRTSLLIGISAALISFLIGVAAGFMAGYYEGIIGIIFSRTVDVLLSFPVIILIILIVALFGNSLSALIFILGLTGWMGLFKIIRSEIIILKTKDFFVTSKLLGLSNIQLIIKDALPVFIVPALTNLIFQINNVIMAESSLSYLGLGVENKYPSWGAMIQSGQEYISSAWWLMFFPALMIILTLQSIKGLGNIINSSINPGLINDK